MTGLWGPGVAGGADPGPVGVGPVRTSTPLLVAVPRRCRGNARPCVDAAGTSAGPSCRRQDDSGRAPVDGDDLGKELVVGRLPARRLPGGRKAVGDGSVRCPPLAGERDDARRRLVGDSDVGFDGGSWPCYRRTALRSGVGRWREAVRLRAVWRETRRARSGQRWTRSRRRWSGLCTRWVPRDGSWRGSFCWKTRSLSCTSLTRSARHSGPTSRKASAQLSLWTCKVMSAAVILNSSGARRRRRN